jgi:hypothetical protein
LLNVTYAIVVDASLGQAHEQDDPNIAIPGQFGSQFGKEKVCMHTDRVDQRSVTPQ